MISIHLVKIVRTIYFQIFASEFNEKLREKILLLQMKYGCLYLTYCNVTVNAGGKFKELLKVL